jgi:hypothetical protein
MPRKETSESIVDAHFYEPLYTLRDEFFRDGELSALRSYLRNFEIIVQERYYHEELLETGDEENLQVAQALVNELTDELEIYVLMEEAK